MTEQLTVWMATRAEDPGGIPCIDDDTARSYAEYQYLEGQHPDDTAGSVLTWDMGCLLDRGQDTGWTFAPVPVIRPADVPVL